MTRLYNARIWTPEGLLSGELHTSGRYICRIGRETPTFHETAAASVPETSVCDTEVDCGGGLLLPFRGGGINSVKLLLSEAAALQAAGVHELPGGLRPGQAADLVLIDLNSDELRPDDTIFRDGSWVVASVSRLYRQTLISKILHYASQKDVSFSLLNGFIFWNNKSEFHPLSKHS
jgi:hypothetical protein